MAIAMAVLTILGPALAPLLVLWLERVMAKKQQRNSEDIDAFIAQHLAGDKSGLTNLALKLDELHRKAQRKIAGRR